MGTLADLTVCPSCDSALVQPLRWQECADGKIALELRCPECFAWMHGRFDASDVRALDDALRRPARRSGKPEERVRENMGELADRLAHALELDLVGADDFLSRAAA